MKRVDVASKLTAVTVYQDRAQLFHTASIALSPDGASASEGEVALIFAAGDWNRADRDTLQVSISKGSNDVILRGVQFRTTHTTEDLRPAKRAIAEELEKLEAELVEAQQQLTISTMQLSAVESIVVKLNDTTPSSANSGSDDSAMVTFMLQPKAQQRAFDFVFSKLDETKSLIRKQRAVIADIEDKIRNVRNRRSSIGIHDEKKVSKDVAEVLLVVLRPSQVELMLSYSTVGASWTPVYDFRVDAKSKKIGIAYNAMVQQSGTADWEKVQLELSTATPHFGGCAPTLGRWNISLTPPYHRSFPVCEESYPGCMMQQMMPVSTSNMIPIDMPRVSLAPSPPPPPPRAAAATESAVVSSSSTSTTFTIAGNQTIRCDGTPVKVSIMQADLPVHLRYSAVPKLDTHTFLKVKATNTTGFLFLPGRVNTFADNQFIAKSSIDTVANGDEFWAFLGVDDAVLVTRKLVHRKLIEKSSMFGGKKTRVEYKYLFTARNTKRTIEEVVIWDQFPISQDKKITVNVVTPTKDDNPNVRFEVNEFNFIEWFYNLKPNSTESFDFVFHVDYPAEERVTGV